MPTVAHPTGCDWPVGSPYWTYYVRCVADGSIPRDEILGQDDAREGWTPALTSPEALTPLPLVDQALPIIGMIAGLVGHGKLARYRVAILRELATQPRSRLSIRAIHDSIAWMEPSSVTRLVQHLRDADLLTYNSRNDYYQLSREARVVAAICGALTTSDVDFGRIIKVLAATMRLADAMNAPSQVAYSTFLSAIAVLEFDYEELQRLLDDFSEESLREAAKMAGGHVEDMRSLLEEQADMFARFHGDVDFLEHDHRAHDMIASVGHLADEVVNQLSKRAAMRLRGAMRIDRQDLRNVLQEASVEDLADLVVDSARAPIFLSAVNTVAAFTALDDYLDRTRQRPLPLPQPTTLPVHPPADQDVDPIAAAVAALQQLAEVHAPLSDWVVSRSWVGALLRNVHAVEAWARHGPGGDGSLSIVLEARTNLDNLGRGEVGWISHTSVRPTDRTDSDAG
jgi:predicted transcriptional regulator